MPSPAASADDAADTSALRAASLARAALATGGNFAQSGDLAQARRWLERAERLAPADQSVRLALASTQLRQGDPGCRAGFASVAQAEDVREAWLGLIAACRLQGDWQEAAAAAASLLSRHAAGRHLPRQVLDEVARAVDAPGWCAVDPANDRLLVGLAAPAAPGRGLQVILDGRLLPHARGGDVRLPQGWRMAWVIEASLGDRALLGAPISVTTILRVEGFVAAVDGGLSGWAWHPHDPDTDPVLDVVPLHPGARPIRLQASYLGAIIPHRRLLARPRGFALDAARLAATPGPLAVSGADRRALVGSPLDPGLERESRARTAALLARRHRLRPANRPLPPLPPALFQPAAADLVGPAPRGGRRRRPVDVVVPVYGGGETTLRCLGSVLAGLPSWARLLVVDDASPDPALAAALDRLAEAGRLRLIRHETNLGFPGAANSGIRFDPARDVVLLNSDTLVPPGWLARLREAAYAEAATGSATPLSNDATILSYPAVGVPNPVPDLAGTIALDRITARVNAGRTVEVPTAVGFCAYVKRDCLRDVGLLREDIFAQGYGEENDFCIRARHLGWRHTAATDVFVGHVGGQSFGAARDHLLARNVAILERLHPGYLDLIEAFGRADPLAVARRRLDMARWRAGRRAAGAVLLITHAEAGGVERRVGERANLLRAEGLRPIVLAPDETADGAACVLSESGGVENFPNLRFAIPRELDALARFLRADRPRSAEVHHLAGHDHAVLGICARLGIPYDMILHDYASFCPRITLVGTAGRYCGEPDLAGCDACIADNGSRLDPDIGVRALRERSAAELAGAARVIAPSADLARRIRRRFPGIEPIVDAWEEAPSRRRPAAAPAVGGRICVVGAISTDKGYEVLLGCARDAAERRLPIEFVVAGYSDDDARLLATGRVFLTGPYSPGHAEALIRAQCASFAFLPSVWPETWSYTLSEAWAAGLDVAAFDLGAQAARIRQSGRGWLLPLGLPAPMLNARLLDIARMLSR